MAARQAKREKLKGKAGGRDREDFPGPRKR